ncbi:MAG: ParA family protein [Tissierellia bacterium]|nr:ParA family protein [Tissierellia bacterium]
MGKITTIFNQKGGVGKTTTAINLSAAIADKGFEVLAIDCDPQGNFTSGLGLDKRNLEHTLYELISGKGDITDTIQDTHTKNLSIIPSNSNLAAAEIELANLSSWWRILKDIVDSVEMNYDYIIIDAPPSLGILSLMALSSSNGVLIPVQSEYYALEGISQLFDTIELIKNTNNPKLQVYGVLMTMFDARNNLAKDVFAEINNFFKDKVFETIIPRNVRLAEAPSHGESIFTYDKTSKGAEAYLALADEFIERTVKL